MSRWEGSNRDLVSVSVDVSHEDLGRHKGIRFCFPKKTTVDVTATFNSESYSVRVNDNKDQNYQVSTNYYEENYKKEYTIYQDKQSPSAS